MPNPLFQSKGNGVKSNLPKVTCNKVENVNNLTLKLHPFINAVTPKSHSKITAFSALIYTGDAEIIVPSSYGFGLHNVTVTQSIRENCRTGQAGGTSWALACAKM